MSLFGLELQSASIESIITG